MTKPTTFQTARHENEMRRIILAHSKPHWSHYALTPEETASLIRKGAITDMPEAKYKDLGAELQRLKHRDSVKAWGKKKETH